MYKVLYALIHIVWILDILNMPFMEILDTTYPINGWAWLLIFLVIPGTAKVVRYKYGDD